MRISRRLLQLAPIFFLIVANGLLFALPSVVASGPLPQGQVTPRPTVALPTATPEVTRVTRKVDLTLIVDKAEARPGDLLRYQAQVANVTGQVATNIWLTCDLPEGVAIEEVSTTKGEIHEYGQRISVEMGRFHAAFESEFVEIEARIRNDVTPGTELIHRANLTSDQAGGGERDAETVSGDEVEMLAQDMVKTLVIGEKPEPTGESEETTALPVTGNGTISLWAIVGFVALIVIVALVGSRGRIHLSR
jgi:uncharacterized repeat protein (TIGR01451 family)